MRNYIDIISEAIADHRNDKPAPTPETGAPLHDLTANNAYPEDVYAPEGRAYYGGEGPIAFRKSVKFKGLPNEPVQVFAVVPKGEAQEIKSGDWVFMTPQYAEHQGSSQFGDTGYDVVDKMVYARDIFTDGDSINRWGYFPQHRIPVR